MLMPESGASTVAFSAAGSHDFSPSSISTSSIDGHHASPLTGNAQIFSVESTFVKGINFNGPSMRIDGDRWISHQKALRDGLVISPVHSYESKVMPQDITKKKTRSILKTGIQPKSSKGQKDILMGQSLDNGEYEVGVWVMSPTKRDRIFDIELEGQIVDRVTVSGTPGEWQRHIYQTTVTDGELNLVLDKVRKTPVIAGLDIYALAEDVTDMSFHGPLPMDKSFDFEEGGAEELRVDDADGYEAEAEVLVPELLEPPVEVVREAEAEVLVPELLEPPIEVVREADAEDPEPELLEPPIEVVDAIEAEDPVPAELIEPAIEVKPVISSSSHSPFQGTLIWQNAFTDDWQQQWPNFQNTTAPDNRQAIDDPTGEMNEILRVSYQKGKVGPSGGTQFKSTFAPMQSATLEYSLRFKEGFDPVLGGKLPGFTGGLANRKRENTGGNTPDGTDGWSVRLGFRPARSNPDGVAIFAYSYLPPGQQNLIQNNEYIFDEWGNKSFWSGQGKWGVSTHFLNPENPESGQDLEIKTGEWYKVSVQVTLNTPGQNDGFIKGFIQQPRESEAALAMHIPDLKFHNKGSNLPIDRVFFSTFFGGASDIHKARRDEHIDFANFAVYRH